MKVTLDNVDEEVSKLVAYHEKNGMSRSWSSFLLHGAVVVTVFCIGFKALHTRLRIFYGGNFDEVDVLSEEEIDRYLEDIKTSRNTKQAPREIETKERSPSFTNVYNELTFYRKPEVKFRFNKL